MPVVGTRRLFFLKSPIVGSCLVLLLLTQVAWSENGDGESTVPVSETRELTLDEAYRLAVANEEQVKIAERELAKAQLLPWRAIAQLTPRADIAGTYTRNKDEIAFTGVPGGGGAGGGERRRFPA